MLCPHTPPRSLIIVFLLLCRSIADNSVSGTLPTQIGRLVNLGSLCVPTLSRPRGRGTRASHSSVAFPGKWEVTSSVDPYHRRLGTWARCTTPACTETSSQARYHHRSAGFQNFEICALLTESKPSNTLVIPMSCRCRRHGADFIAPDQSQHADGQVERRDSFPAWTMPLT